MKLLLDEQMPRKIALQFPKSFTVDTVRSQGWSGIRNGELLTLAASRGYDALISADKNMAYQQNEEALQLSVVVLSVIRLRIDLMVPLIPQALEELKTSSTPRFIHVGK